jgi:hypothetical protein
MVVAVDLVGFLRKLKKIPCRHKIKRDANAGMDILHGNNQKLFCAVDFYNPVSVASNKLTDRFHNCSRSHVYVKTRKALAKAG